uniref:alkaline phosphatase D family protein n=1 Tax=Paractinoplanes polyasparticus TaxID=2856853 RepID=UPI003F6914A8
MDVLAARAHADPARGLLGAAQRAWLINGLRESRATWKVIANDTPLGLVVPDRPAAQEGVAQRDPGAQGPRARVRSGASVGPPARRDRHRVPDRRRALHRRAPLRPARAAVQDFTPFWEFVSGPAHAGAFGPFPLDRTFGPRAVFQHAPPAPFTSPAVGFQHFGEVEIDAETREFKVSLRDRDGVNLWSVTLPP